MNGNSVIGVGKIEGAKDISSPEDAFQGHAISEMSTSKIPELCNNGPKRIVEKGSNNGN